MKDRKPLQIFVSYSHEDGAWTRRLFNEYIRTTQGDCRIWTDAQIRVGQQWGAEIERHLQASGLGILLVSKSFLKSKFIMGEEYPRIIERLADPSFRLVWIPVDVKSQQIERAAPALLKIQGAVGLCEGLPASPDDPADAARVERVREHIRQQIQSAVDPIGAELRRLVEDRYEISEWLGEGNLASIYKARDRLLGRDVALKVLKDKDQRGAFLNDVRDAIRTCDQPSFVSVYDAGMDESATYCVLQFIQGRNLRQEITDHPGGLPIDRTRRIFLGIAAALARAHAMGVTYGNIKPSNIILSDDDEPFILPIGRRRDSMRHSTQLADLLQRVQQRAAAGLAPDDLDREDLGYQLPEHFCETYESIDDRKSDQYMLGLLAYEMISGALPATLVHPECIVTNGFQAFEELPAVTCNKRLCPQRIAKLVATMTSRRQSRRYPSLQAVLDAAQLLEDLSLGIARDSYRRCAARPDFDRQFFARFYGEFLRLCPGAQTYFAAFEQNRWERQHQMLKDAILMMFGFRQMNESDTELNLLTRIAAKHRAIPIGTYDPFVDALMHTVCGHEAAQLAPFDPECVESPLQRELIETHWRKAIEPAVDYMKKHSQAALAAAA